MDRNLVLDIVRATEAAAMASGRIMGLGDEVECVRQAAMAMKHLLDTIDGNVSVAIGKKESFRSFSLGEGDILGSGRGPKLEIAVNPLDGARVCATGGLNAISLLAITEKSHLFRPPVAYMEKIAVGPEARDMLDIRETPKENLKRLAEVKKCRVRDLTCVILDRKRHLDLIQNVRSCGARIQLIQDGDVASAISTCLPQSGIDIIFGEGGSSEGVIAAAAIKCLGGGFQGIFRPRTEEEKKLLKSQSIGLEKVFETNDLIQGEVVFSATGVTNGNFLKGVLFHPWGAMTHSMVMRSSSGTIRHIKAEHRFDRKPRYS